MLTDEEICCEAMKNRIFRKHREPDVKYEDVYRCYSYCTKDGYFDTLRYCPWCGKKLPEELNPDHTIKKEFGYDYVRFSDEPEYKELPPEVKKEFETDEWWKKRNIGPDDPGF